MLLWGTSLKNQEPTHFLLVAAVTEEIHMDTKPLSLGPLADTVSRTTFLIIAEYMGCTKKKYINKHALWENEGCCCSLSSYLQYYFMSQFNLLCTLCHFLKFHLPNHPVLPLFHEIEVL